MGNLIYISAAFLIGAAISLQPPINASMAQGLGSSLLAASVSIFISLVFVIILWLSLGQGTGDISQFTILPWWVIIGGIAGVIFVAGGIIIAPETGVAIFFVCVVAGQLIGSALLDQFGIFGLSVKPLNLMKITGISLVLIGAFLVQNSHS